MVANKYLLRHLTIIEDFILGDKLKSENNEFLQSGGSILSSNKCFLFSLQHDGNLVHLFTPTRTKMWSSDTQ